MIFEEKRLTVSGLKDLRFFDRRRTRNDDHLTRLFTTESRSGCYRLVYGSFIFTPFRSEMFIDRNIKLPFAGGAECFWMVPVYLSSAPPNGAGGIFSSIYKDDTPNGVPRLL